MQEYEQHLIDLGVKPGSKKEQRFHTYKKNKKGRGGCQQAQKGVYYQPMLAPQYMGKLPFFSLHHKVVTEEDVVVAGVAAVEAAQVVPSSSNLLNDTQYQVLPSKNPGLKLIMLLGDPLHCVFPVAPPEGEKTLSVLTLPEREKTPCVQSHRRGKRLCVYSPYWRGERLCV